MVIRTLKAEELGTAKKIWETCFDDQPAFVEWYFQRRIKAHEVLGLFRETENETEALVADLHMAPYRLRFREKTFSSAYLIALATMPEYRMKGFAKELLKTSLTLLAQKEKVFTLLLPFNVKFYTRLGWGIVSRRRLIRFTSATDSEKEGATFSFPAFAEKSPGEVRLFPRTPPENTLIHLKNIYAEWTKGFPGLLLRSDRDWEGLLFDLYLEGGKTWLFLNSHGEPEGYALTYLNENEPTIREIAYTTQSAGQALLRKILKNGSSSLAWKAPLADPLVDSLQAMTSVRVNPRAGQAFPRQIKGITNSVEPFMLGRITNLPGFLKELPCPQREFTLNIELHDPLLPHNSGVFQLTQAPDGCFDCIPSPKPPEVKTEIGFFTGLLAGDPVTLEKLAATCRTAPELIWVREEKYLALLGKLFPEAINYINDYF